jgi:hypothetical protein
MTFSDCLTMFGTQYKMDFDNEVLVNVWRDALRGLQVYAVAQAAREWIATQKWAPTPSEIRKRALELETPDATGDQPLPPDAPGFWVFTRDRAKNVSGWQRVTPAEVVG